MGVGKRTGKRRVDEKNWVQVWLQRWKWCGGREWRGRMERVLLGGGEYTGAARKGCVLGRKSTSTTCAQISLLVRKI